MHRLLAVSLFIALLAFGIPALAQEHGGSAAATGETAAHGSEHAAAPHGPEWVQQKVKVCAGCHGKHGASPTTPMFPIIAGQYESYLFHALKAYRDGTRSSAIMAAQVQGLTNAQLEALAEYFASQESPLYTPTLERE